MQDLEALYKKHGRIIYYFLLSKTNDPLVSEELTQETFYQALKSLNTFRGDSSPLTWLTGIANNVLKVHLRKIPLEGLNDDIATPFSFDGPEIFKLLYQLENPMKEVVYLRLSGELSFREIGEIMGHSENWARVNFFRAKQKLLEGLKHE